MAVATVEWISLTEAGHRLGCSAQTVKNMAGRGQLSGYRSPLGLIVAKDDVERLVAARAPRPASSGNAAEQ